MSFIQSPVSYITAFTGWVAGTFAGGVVGMATSEPGTAAAYAGVISALVVAGFMFVGKLLDKYYDGKDKKVKRDDELH
jgi:membrane associated rhomboid family serine protease